MMSLTSFHFSQIMEQEWFSEPLWVAIISFILLLQVRTIGWWQVGRPGEWTDQRIQRHDWNDPKTCEDSKLLRTFLELHLEMEQALALSLRLVTYFD